MTILCVSPENSIFLTLKVLPLLKGFENDIAISVERFSGCNLGSGARFKRTFEDVRRVLVVCLDFQLAEC